MGTHLFKKIFIKITLISLVIYHCYIPHHICPPCQYFGGCCCLQFAKLLQQQQQPQLLTKNFKHCHFDKWRRLPISQRLHSSHIQNGPIAKYSSSGSSNRIPRVDTESSRIVRVGQILWIDGYANQGWIKTGWFGW
jgi:hypothetical protein